MSQNPPDADDNDHQPLLRTAFLVKLVVVIIAMACLILAISFAGRWYGRTMASGGYSESLDPVDIFIGEDHLNLPQNVIRNASQRQTGTMERIDVALTWPQMQGFGSENRQRFIDIRLAGDLIFLDISQSTMSRDMSGRLEPIYSHLIQGEPQPGPAGLSIFRLKADTGYQNETLLTAKRVGEPDYVVRCVLPKQAEEANSADCQRDVHMGNDLSVLYRFSSQHLNQWAEIDQAVGNWIRAHLRN